MRLSGMTQMFGQTKVRGQLPVAGVAEAETDSDPPEQQPAAAFACWGLTLNRSALRIDAWLVMPEFGRTNHISQGGPL
jgi:hypothetical protein